MHICVVTSEFPPILGGVAYHASGLAKALVKRGQSVTVLTRGSPKRLTNEYIDGINVYRVPFVRTYPVHTQIHGLFVNNVFRSLRDNFDVVHMHIPSPPFVHTSLPMLVTAHTLTRGGYEEFHPNMHYLSHKLFARFTFPLESKILSRADLIAAVSSPVAKQLKELYEVGEDRVEVVGNAVDPEFFFPKRMEEPKRTDIQYILFTGRFVVRKGLINLIKSAEIVCQKYPSVSFLLVGTGPLEPQLRKLVERSKLSKKIFFVGQVGKTKIRKYYQNATIFVLPSFTESFPNVVLEAMACGIPIVATKVGDVPKLIKDGKTGVLVRPKDSDSLAQAILKLLDDEALRKKMGKSCREIVESHYSWDALSDKTLDYYKLIAE